LGPGAGPRPPSAAVTAMHPEPILKVRLEFRVRPDELHELRSVLLSFAAEERLTVNDVGTRIPPKQERPLFHIELEQGASVQVVVTNIREVAHPRPLRRLVSEPALGRRVREGVSGHPLHLRRSNAQPVSFEEPFAARALRAIASRSRFPM
jgi:hypothetical protein